MSINFKHSIILGLSATFLFTSVSTNAENNNEELFSETTISSTIVDSSSTSSVESESQVTTEETTNLSSAEEVISNSDISSDEEFETNIPENDLFDDEYTYPSNRSDLEGSVNPSKARAVNINITNPNKPASNFTDVSSHNGYISVDSYKLMKSYGVTGVVVKLSEGLTYINPYAKDQIKNAQQAGLRVSVYHYSWFKTEQEAINEANYFASFAESLGLPKSTVMVNDLEDPKLKYLNGHTANSKSFEKALNNRGFGNVNHYIGAHWINDNRINIGELGYKKTWIAAYPYTPTTTQQYTQYGAWQWTSKMSFPSINGVFDMSSDYAGYFSSGPQGEYISDGRYVSIQKTGYSTWSNFDWKKRDITDNIYQKTFKARGRYEHANGITYYSLYDDNGVWYGYVDADATRDERAPQGEYIPDGRFVSINKTNYNTWSNFSWKKKESSEKIYQRTFKARGRYEHANGSTYYSLYDEKGTWYGYINASATQVEANPQGRYISDGRFVSINKKNYNTWSNFSWKKRQNGEAIYQRTFVARGKYNHFNGSTYLSLYDLDGRWHGYINSSATQTVANAQGDYISYRKYVTIESNNYNTWSNFNWKKRNSSAAIYKDKFLARGRYEHANGSTYLSLYDDNGNWHGYINSNATKLVK